MYSRIRHPDKVSPSALDDYLEAGWRCTGQSIYTAHFMRFPPDSSGRIYSTMPTRLPLQGYRFRKSLRKLWRKNEKHFTWEAGQPFQFDEAAQQVHQAYGRAFPDRTLADEEVYRSRPSGPFTFDTREIRVYDAGKLVAFSLFNLGERSLYSSQGIYQPDYGRYSLGFFTMLLEISYAQSQGISHYYPGYVVPGYEEFDYKHRVGPLEYYELSSGSWKPFATLEEGEVPINRMWQELRKLQGQLQQRGVESHLAEYAWFDIRFYEKRSLPFLEMPVVLVVQSDRPKRYTPVLSFCPESLRFRLVNGKFFGMGVHHLPAYKQVLAERPRIISYPIAALEPKAEGLRLEDAVQQLCGRRARGA